jgi:membrane-anchored mycosin MYCP
MRKIIPAALAAALAAAAASVALAPVAATASTAATAAPALTAASAAAAGTAPSSSASPTAKPSSSASPTTAPPSTQCLGAATKVSAVLPWAQQLLQPKRVWQMTTGTGQVVAVVDSGVSGTAPALSNVLLPGGDVLTGGAGTSDCEGHGSFVAGLIAAQPTRGVGLAGIAPGALILPVNVINPSQFESNQVVSSSAVAAGIMFAVNSGATVVDVSTASTPAPSAALRAAVAYALSQNVVVVAPVTVSTVSATTNVTSYPADYPGVLAVSAIDSTGVPVAAGGRDARVDLAAPGAGLTSIGPRGPGQISGDGAALATAFVAGTAALVRTYYPQLTAAQVAHRLEATADQPGTTLPNPQVGYGIVDPYTAVTTVLPEESGALGPTAPPVRPIHLAPPVVPDSWPVTAALIVCAVIVAGIVAAASTVHILRRGRRRGWRPPPGRSSWHKPAAGPSQQSVTQAADLRRQPSDTAAK